MLDVSRFDAPLLEATVLITGSPGRVAAFGTGFIVGRNAEGALVLTCAHVLRDIDQGDGITVDRRPATIVAAGTSEGVDLALLQVPGLAGPSLPLLPENVTPTRGEAVRIVGFQSLGPNQRLQNPRSARLGNMARFESSESGERAWAWWLQMSDDGGLEKGFSGSPVLDLATGYVMAVVSLRQGASAGLAVCTSELAQLWPEAIDQLFTSPRLPEPVGLPTAPTPELTRRAEELSQATAAALPPGLQSLVGDAAGRIAEAIALARTHEQVRAHVAVPAAYQTLLEALAGRTVKANDTVLSFGADNQFGDLKIGNLSGGDLITVNFHLQGVPASTHEGIAPVNPPRVLDLPIRLYIGHGADDEAVALACRELAARGLSVGRVLVGDRMSESGLRAELDDAGAVIVWLTPQLLTEPAMYSELQPALTKLRSLRPKLPRFLILDGVAEARLRVRPAELGAEIVGSTALPGLLFKRLSEASLSDLRARGEALLHLAAHPDAALEQGGDLMLDWLQFFTPQPANATTWRETLMPALLDCKRALTSAGVRAVALKAQARLSVGLALGYVFRESSGFRVRIDQRGEWWSTDTPLADQLPLVIAGERPGPGGPDLSIEISSSRWDAGAAVEAWMGRNPGVIGRRWQCRVTANLDGGQARGIAGVIVGAMEAAKREPHPPAAIHIFGAMPLGLAVLLGWHLNVCGPVWGYDAINTNSDYQAACWLG